MKEPPNVRRLNLGRVNRTAEAGEVCADASNESVDAASDGGISPEASASRPWLTSVLGTANLLMLVSSVCDSVRGRTIVPLIRGISFIRAYRDCNVTFSKEEWAKEGFNTCCEAYLACTGFSQSRHTYTPSGDRNFRGCA